MSIQAVGTVLEESKAKQSTRLVLIALANHADKHGTCFPSLKLICTESLVERRTSQEAIARLIEAGELEVLVEAYGKTHRPPLYWLKLPGLTGEIVDDHPYFEAYGWDLLPGAKSAPPPDANIAPGSGAKSAPPGCEKPPPPGAKHCNGSIREPSVNRQGSVGTLPDEVATPLRQLADLKDATLDPPAVERAIAAYPDRDHAGEAEALLAWHQSKPSAKLRAVAQAYRNWLKGSDPLPPTGKPAGSSTQPSDSPYGQKVTRSE